MAIADDRLKQFFSKQKVGAFDALKQSAKNIIPKNYASNENPQNKQSVLSSNQEIEAPLQTQKVASLIPNIDISTSVKTFVSSLENETDTNTGKGNAEPLAIRKQPVSDSLADSKHSVSNPLAIRQLSVIDSLPETLANPLAKAEEITFTDLRVFSKKERELLVLIFWQCHHNCSLISPPISTEEIRHTLKISAERVRNLIFRISRKKGVKVTQYKTGQNAYREFELPKSLYQWMIDHQNNQIPKY